VQVHLDWHVSQISPSFQVHRMKIASPAIGTSLMANASATVLSIPMRKTRSACTAMPNVAGTVKALIQPNAPSSFFPFFASRFHWQRCKNKKAGATCVSDCPQFTYDRLGLYLALCSSSPQGAPQASVLLVSSNARRDALDPLPPTAKKDCARLSKWPLQTSVWLAVR
jgi:hypothetical protein